MALSPFATINRRVVITSFLGMWLMNGIRLTIATIGKLNILFIIITNKADTTL